MERRKIEGLISMNLPPSTKALMLFLRCLKELIRFEACLEHGVARGMVARVLFRIDFEELLCEGECGCV